jgi:predicted RNA-binding protein with PUA-like domain
MRHWLMKSEPDVFSIDDLSAKGAAGWDGVRNYQARNFLRAMHRGDQAFFYHSSTKSPAIVGIVEIVREAYPDPTQFDPAEEAFDAASTRDHPRWDQVDVRFLKRFPAALPLEEIRKIPALKGMVLLHHGRLSVQPVTDEEWAAILKKMG